MGFHTKNKPRRAFLIPGMCLELQFTVKPTQQQPDYFTRKLHGSADARKEMSHQDTEEGLQECRDTNSDTSLKSMRRRILQKCVIVMKQRSCRAGTSFILQTMQV